MDYYPFGLTFNSYSRTASTPQNFKLASNEEQVDWGVGVSDFNARTYDATIGRFYQIDPMADKRDWLTLYNYVQNNPLMRIDPTGMLDDNNYSFDEKTGEVELVEKNDDTHDQIVKTDRKGDVKTFKRGNKEGQAKVRIGGIEKGILKDKQNLKTGDTTIDVNGKNEDGTNQPTTSGVQEFVTKLSNMMNIEMSGAYFSKGDDEDSDISKITIDEYEGNGPTSSSTSVSNITGYTKNTHFHTHPVTSDSDPANLERPSRLGVGEGDEGFKKRNVNNYKKFIESPT